MYRVHLICLAYLHADQSSLPSLMAKNRHCAKDCLDYCNEYLVQNFSYNVASPTPPLEEYMREYREVPWNPFQFLRLQKRTFTIMTPTIL